MNIEKINKELNALDLNNELEIVKFYELREQNLKNFIPKNELELSLYCKMLNKISSYYSECKNYLKAIELVELSFNKILQYEFFVSNINNYEPFYGSVFLRVEYLNYLNKYSEALNFLTEVNISFPENIELKKQFNNIINKRRRKIPEKIFYLGIFLSLIFLVLIIFIKMHNTIILFLFISSVVMLIVGYLLSNYYSKK